MFLSIKTCKPILTLNLKSSTIHSARVSSPEILLQLFQAGHTLGAARCPLLSVQRLLRLNRTQLQLLHLMLQLLHLRLQQLHRLRQPGHRKQSSSQSTSTEYFSLKLLKTMQISRLTPGSSAGPPCCPEPVCGCSAPALGPTRPAARTL